MRGERNLEMIRLVEYLALRTEKMREAFCMTKGRERNVVRRHSNTAWDGEEGGGGRH